MVTNINERIRIMGEILFKIEAGGYTYDLKQSSSDWDQIPPPAGTKMNCKAAANLAIRMAKAEGIEKGLILVKAEPKNGFFVPVAPGVKALGNNEPPVNDNNVRGWEFSNHYRVKDTNAAKIYDPTFCTSGNFNPIGLKALNETKTEKSTKGGKLSIKMISLYGEKYEITRSNDFKVKLNKGKIIPQDCNINNESYIKEKE